METQEATVLMRLFTLLCSLLGASRQQQAGIFCLHRYSTHHLCESVCVCVREAK